MDAIRRDAFVCSGALLPDVPACGLSRQRTARPGLGPHTHPNEYEVSLITDGAVEWWVEDRILTARTGEVIITKPGERHGGVDAMYQPSELIWFQLARHPVPQEIVSAADQTAALQAELPGLRARHLAASPQLRLAITSLVEEHRSPAATAAMAARAFLNTVLVLLGRESTAGAGPPVTPSAPVTAALAWIEEHLCTDFTVADVAAAVGLSDVRLQARFRRELGSPIGEYRSRARIYRAKALLRETSAPVTGIAHALGFSTSQYFATVFRRYVGVAPSEYRDGCGPTYRGLDGPAPPGAASRAAMPAP